MYYLKLEIGTTIFKSPINSNTFISYNLVYQNNIAYLQNLSDKSIAFIFGECIIKDTYILLPLEKKNGYYINYNDNNGSIYWDTYLRTSYTSSLTNKLISRGTILDDDYKEVGERPYILGNNYDKGSCVIIKDNPNDIIFKTPSGSSTIKELDGYSVTNNIDIINTINDIMGGSQYLYDYVLSITNNIGSLIATILNITTYSSIDSQYLHAYCYTYTKDVIGFCGTTTKSIFPSYFFPNQNQGTLVKPNDLYTTNVDSKEINILNTTDCNMYCWTSPTTSKKSGQINIFIDLSKTNLNINDDLKRCVNISLFFNNVMSVWNGRGDSLVWIYQDTYTPTNKLKTPTFSDLSVLHNEDTGTYALTFKANNPNSVSVNVDINISGREGTDTITLPAGDSEWSFLLLENKSGTLQGTNINALGYENADDTPTYNYYEYTPPGYLREIVVSQVYLSTTDDKNYNLNIIINNPNSVDIPCIIHYGKSGENTKSVTLTSSYNVFKISGVDNVNGFVWVHPEKIEGYYQLPDTEVVNYTKLPLPPVPSSTGITLFKNNNNNKVVNKGYKLETYKVLNGTFRDSVNILNPVFQIQNDEVPDCNYCYIADFRRYYYIDTITCVRTGLYEIECSVDVLYTYKDNILNSEQYISRQENEYNELLVDNMVTFDNKSTYTIYYKNIDELDYGIDDKKSTSIPSEKVNMILSWYKTK